MRFLDSSIPLAVLLEEPRESREDAVEIFAAVEDGRERVVASPFGVAEIVYVLERARWRRAKVREALRDLLGAAGLRLVAAEPNLVPVALDLYRTSGADFIDCHNVATMRALGLNEIFSFDRHFDAFPGITRGVALSQ